MARFTNEKWASKLNGHMYSLIALHSFEKVLELIKEKGTVEEDELESAMFIPRGEHSFVKGKTYDMGRFYGYAEFVITDDGRLFYLGSMMDRIEILPDEDEEEANDQLEIVSGDFLEGRTVTVRICDKMFTRKVRYSRDKFADLYITVNGFAFTLTDFMNPLVEEDYGRYLTK